MHCAEEYSIGLQVSRIINISSIRLLSRGKESPLAGGRLSCQASANCDINLARQRMEKDGLRISRTLKRMVYVIQSENFKASTPSLVQKERYRESTVRLID